MVATHRGTHFAPKENETMDFVVASEVMPLDSKLKILEELGKEEWIEIFKNWKPRTAPGKAKSAPLDQRVNILVSDNERIMLDSEAQALKLNGEKITLSQMIRNRALGSVDLERWRTIAEKAIVDIQEIFDNQKKLQEQKMILEGLIEEEEDTTEIEVYNMEIAEINAKLSRLVAQSKGRNNRLTGRMSMAESEHVKWRANRLCISSSDYLRMMIFNLEPNSEADSHFSFDAKRRFYISIVDVAENGWGTPPKLFNCSQCGNYLEEIEKLQERIRQLESFN